MKAIAITLEGVLRRDQVSEKVDQVALMLYLALVAHFRVVILGTDDTEKDERFLKENGFLKYVEIEPENAADSPMLSPRRERQLTRLKGRGWELEFVVVPDPWMAKYLFTAGYTTMMYLPPAYPSKAFQPNSAAGTRAWGELIQQVDYTRHMKAKEREKDAEDDDGFDH